MRDGNRWRASAVFALLVAGVASIACAAAWPTMVIAQTTEPKGGTAPAAQPMPAAPASPGAPELAPPAGPPVNEEEQQAIALLVDLQRYSSESIQALNRARTEPNRIRAAVLLTMPGAGPPDDARAIALLESVSGKTPGSSPIKMLAAVLLAQVTERIRGMSEERKKSAAAQEKLDQLRAVERSLLLERNRNAGGAGGGGGGGGTGR
jgi:hypothetical protein